MIIWCRHDNSVNEGGGLSDKVTSLLLKSTVSLQMEAAATHGSASLLEEALGKLVQSFSKLTGFLNVIVIT